MKQFSAKELIDSGLLFMINDTILHRLGLALTVTGNPETDGLLEVWDHRDDCIWFDEETISSGIAKYLEFVKTQEESMSTIKKRTDKEKAEYYAEK